MRGHLRHQFTEQSDGRAENHDVSRASGREDTDIKAVRPRGVAGGDGNRLGRRHAADGRDVTDVTQHAPWNDASAARRVGAEREPCELAFGAHPLDRAPG